MIVLFLLRSLSFSQLRRRVFLVVIRKIDTHAHCYLQDESEEVIRIQARLHRMIETNWKIEALFQHLMKPRFYDWDGGAR